MAEFNRRGGLPWTPQVPPVVDAEALAGLERDGVVTIDARPRRAYARGHRAGAVNLEFGNNFSTYLGWLYPAATRFSLVVNPGMDVDLAIRQCARIGIETIIGVHIVENDASATVDDPKVVGMKEMHAAWQQGGRTILDVRQPREWAAGHVPGAIHIHLPDLPDRLAELPVDTSIHIHCQSGYRAAVAASLVLASGRDAVLVDGSFDEWKKEQWPIEK